MKTWICTGILGLFVLFPWTGQAADIYKWTDESGVVHVSDTPPAGSAGKKMKTIRSKDKQKSESAGTQSNNANEQEREAPAPVIVVR